MEETPLEVKVAADLRPEIEAEVRAEFVRERGQELAQAKDEMFRIVLAWVLVAAVVGAPIMGLALGTSWRIMMWAAGVRPLF